MSATHLFTFRCRSCKTVMTSPVSGLYRCNACHSGMHLLFSTPILTESDRALAAKGPVFNPGVKKWIPRCAAPDCDKAVSLLYGKSLIEDGALIWFCSAACADLWKVEPATP